MNMIQNAILRKIQYCKKKKGRREKVKQICVCLNKIYIIQRVKKTEGKKKEIDDEKFSFLFQSTMCSLLIKRKRD